MKDLQRHPLNLLPDCSKADYQRLKASIKEHGFDPDFPIILYEDMILDGWQRYTICKELDVPPILTDFDGTAEEAMLYVIRTNTRRNLTSSQWATFIAKHPEVLKAYQQEAKERQLAELKQNKKTKDRSASRKRNGKGEAKDQAAKDLGTTRENIDTATKLKDEDPETFEKVEKGEMSLHKVRMNKKKETMLSDVVLKLEKSLGNYINKVELIPRLKPIVKMLEDAKYAMGDIRKMIKGDNDEVVY